MADILTLTKGNFDQTIKTGTVLVDFWASWCGPCKMVAPILDELNEKLGDKVVFGKVNVDDEMELAGRFEVSSIPTVIVFKDGKMHQSAVGVQQIAKYESMVN